MILSLGGSTGILWQVFTTARTLIRGPRITNTRVLFATTGDGVGHSGAGILVSNSISDATCPIEGTVIGSCQIEFRTAGGLVSEREGIKIRVEQAGTGQNNRGSISNCVIKGAGTGLFFQTLTTNATLGNVDGRIQDWSVAAVVADAPAVYGAFTVSGCEIDQPNSAVAKIFRVTLSGCDFANAPATGTGVIIGAHVTNTCLIGNQTTPNGGTNINNLGTGSEITGNVP
jgi:hypothetical protein